jgi:uncharacterized protein YcbK (DUF882 family)
MLALACTVALARPAHADPPRRANARRVSLSGYTASVGRWHDAARAPAPRFLDDGRMVLRLVSINGRGVAEVTPQRIDGGFEDAARAEVSRVMGDAHADRQAPMDRRLIDVIYQIALHFRAGQVTVVSGYRHEARRSNHALGRAADVVIPGVGDEAVARFAREMGFLGVGVYPRSGFVHVDVRSRSFFWVDRSGPGRRSGRRRRSRGIHEIHGDVARRADEAARARGVQPLGGVAAEADDDEDGAR